MQAAPYLLPSDPRWQRQARPRLAASIALATALVAAMLAMLRLPVVSLIQPGPEILLRLLPEIIEPLAERAAEPPPEVLDPAISDPAPAAAQTPRNATESGDAGETDAAATAAASRQTRDWYRQLETAVKSAGDEFEAVASVNPAMDEKRRRAAEQFYPSRAPEKRHVWDNVETDQLGRKILWSGDCYRIIDDPSPATYEIWREFQQYFVYCRFGDADPVLLPWVEVIRSRYLYLQYPDGEIPADELRRYVER